MTTKTNLDAARDAKQDEFYTCLTDIERELKHYRKLFKGKTVYLNCDDHTRSNFWHYFAYNFEFLGLKRLIATSYRADGGPSYWMEYTGDQNGNRVPDAEEITMHALGGNGDFRSPECVELLKQADIVVTNPPFSLFREYVAQLMEHNKKFLIVGPGMAARLAAIFPLIKSGKLWIGHNNGDMKFVVPDYYAMRETRSWRDADGTNWRSLGNVSWYTNLKTAKRAEEMKLFRSYSSLTNPTYDNYDAIEVGKTVDIPVDYDGVMGVPLTFLAKHNPDQFEIVGIVVPYINGRRKFERVLIQKKAA